MKFEQSASNNEHITAALGTPAAAVTQFGGQRQHLIDITKRSEAATHQRKKSTSVYASTDAITRKIEPSSTISMQAEPAAPGNSGACGCRTESAGQRTGDILTYRTSQWTGDVLTYQTSQRTGDMLTYRTSQ